MPFPPALAAPLSGLTPARRRWFHLATGAALGLLLLWLAAVRFARPPWPVADPDTWGYLHPAVSRLLGGPFAHTYGRAFVYPGWIWLLLKGTGDFRAVTAAQRLLGLAACALLWAAWRQWRAGFPAARLPAWADAGLGLGLVAFFGRAGSVLRFEEQIRPEAVFPFFAALHLCLLLAWGRAWRERRAGRAGVCAAGSLFTAALLYLLKPSFGLAAGAGALPFGLALAAPADGRGRAGLLGALAAGGLLAWALLWQPERGWAAGDPASALFLPQTLLTVHAGPIRDQLLRDARAGTAAPFPAPFMADAVRRLDEAVRAASDPARRPYRTLGYYPDDLLYRPDGFCAWLGTRLPPAQNAAFCLYGYRRAWTRRPGAMLAKAGRQLAVFYSWQCPAFRSATRIEAADGARQTLAFLEEPGHRDPLAPCPPARAWLAASRRLAASGAVFRTPPLLAALDLLAAALHLPLLLLSAAGMLGAARLPPASRAALRGPGLALGLLYALALGSALTVAVVHSLEVHRYTLNLLIYAAPGEAAALAWLAEGVLARRAGNRPRPAPEPDPAAAH